MPTRSTTRAKTPSVADGRGTAVRRDPFETRLYRYPGKGGWTFAIIPKHHAPPATRPWGRTPVTATLDGVTWSTSIWRDTKHDRSLLAVPKSRRGAKGGDDRVTVAFEYVEDTD